MDNPADEWGTYDTMPRELKSAIRQELRQAHYARLDKLKREAGQSGLPSVDLTNEKPHA